MTARSVLFICLLLMPVANAQNISMQGINLEQFGQQNRQLMQKFSMAEYLLNSPLYARMKMSENALARGLLEKAEASYDLAVEKADDRNWLEANAVIDSVLRDLKNSASLLNKKTLDRNIYDETLKRVKAFVYPQWSNLTDFDQQLLDDTTVKVDELQIQAANLAGQDDFEEATNILLEIYKLKSQLLQRLEHDDTIVYDLIFDTPEEEFNYLSQRRNHFNELLEGILSSYSFEEQSLRLARQYMNKSATKADGALAKKNSSEHKQASQMLENSIRDLLTALKILGIRI